MTDSAARARELLAQAGTALYGSAWKTALARDLKVQERSVAFWANGNNPHFDLSHSVFEKLASMLAERQTSLASALEALRKEIPHA